MSFIFLMECSTLMRGTGRLVDGLVNVYMAYSQKNEAKANVFAFSITPATLATPAQVTDVWKIWAQLLQGERPSEAAQAISVEDTFGQLPPDRKRKTAPKTELLQLNSG